MNRYFGKAYASALEWMIEDQCPWLCSAQPNDPEWETRSNAFWAAMAIGNLELMLEEDEGDLL